MSTDGELFYLLDTRGGQGYSCDLADAGKYTAEQAARLRPTDVPVPCDLADAAVVRHVRLDGAALREYVARGRGLNVPA